MSLGIELNKDSCTSKEYSIAECRSVLLLKSNRKYKVLNSLIQAKLKEVISAFICHVQTLCVQIE